MVPGGHGILATRPCLVLGQDMSIISRGLQYSTLMLGSLEEGGALSSWSSSSGTKPSTSVWTGDTTVDVVRGHGAKAVVVAGLLVVVVLVVVVVAVTVVGRVVVRVVVVVVSMYTITEEDVSNKRESGKKQSELTDTKKKKIQSWRKRWRINVKFHLRLRGKSILVLVKEKKREHVQGAAILYPACHVSV